VGRIHDRMPMLVEPERYAAWLDPSRTDPEELTGLLVPASPGRLPVGRREVGGQVGGETSRA
jgi:putative SOS response-associated peptidase YedK